MTVQGYAAKDGSKLANASSITVRRRPTAICGVFRALNPSLLPFARWRDLSRTCVSFLRRVCLLRHVVVVPTKRLLRLPRGSMPVDYRRHDPRQQVIVTISGDVTINQVVRTILQQAVQGTWAYARVWDERASTWSPSTSDLQKIATLNRQLRELHGPRGPVAFVVHVQGEAVRQTFGYRYARALRALDVRTEVFASFSEANAWLLAEQARNRSSPFSAA